MHGGRSGIAMLGRSNVHAACGSDSVSRADMPHGPGAERVAVSRRVAILIENDPSTC